MRKTIVAVLLVVLFGAAAGRALARTEAEDEEEVKRRIAELEKRMEKMEKTIEPMKANLQREAHRMKMRKLAIERMKEDHKKYKPEQLRGIETLYQVANRKWNTPEAAESLKKLIEKYQKANRTGCAVMYLGQMSKDTERERLFTLAIEDYGDCRYGDGVQVGAYARFYLANYYGHTGKEGRARKLRQEIRDEFPDAIDHRGRKLVDLMPKE